MHGIMSTEHATRVITEADYTRLLRLLHRTLQHRPAEQFLLENTYHEISHAAPVRPQAVPPDVVTMNSLVVLADLDTGRSMSVRLVYPPRAGMPPGGLSVLTPLGTALIGRRVGDVLEYPDLDGSHRVRIERLEYQPEAAGRFDL